MGVGACSVFKKKSSRCPQPNRWEGRINHSRRYCVLAGTCTLGHEAGRNATAILTHQEQNEVGIGEKEGGRGGEEKDPQPGEKKKQPSFWPWVRKCGGTSSERALRRCRPALGKWTFLL